MKICFRIWS